MSREKYLDEVQNRSADPEVKIVIVETAKAEMFGNQHSQLLLELLEGVRDEWLGILEKPTSTPAYQKMKQEAGNIGDALVQEITKTANNGNHLVVCSSID